MNAQTPPPEAFPLVMTDAAANKVKALITEENNPNLKLQVFITGGGCSFQYGFTLTKIRVMMTSSLKKTA